ncbi:MAG: class I SAM-dependent methyltransferase [Actinobacteria bacterium]|nr:class I SAM-dependent methyltransferase [Actinomycetota bacterium]
MARFHQNGFNGAHSMLRGAATIGWYAFPGSRILDFGCGSGERVYQYREAGYEAHGYDLMDVVDLRAPADRAFFSAHEAKRVNWSDTHVADDAIRLPYDDASFDFVFSETVIEHCYALDGMMRECARVLKPGGLSLHTFPSRNSVIEPHILVPFGGRIQADWWLRLWAGLGIRNSGQTEMTAAETAKHNRFYLDSGICYRSAEEVAAIAQRHFPSVAYEDRRFYAYDSRRERRHRYLQALRASHPLQEVATIPRIRILAAWR